MIGVFVEWDWLPNMHIRRGVAGHVITEGGCWEWAGCYGAAGYGQVSINGKHASTHRVAYEHFTGQSIPDGMCIDHICRNPPCVNPNHLRVVTRQQNTIENSVSEPAINAAKTHCSRGHEFTPENTYVDPRGKRNCRVCIAEHREKTYHRQREYDRKYRENNRERRREQDRKWRANHRAQISEKDRRYREKKRMEVKQ